MPQNAYEDQRIWDSKDTIPRELQFIQPLNASRNQVARVMVSPRIIVNLFDGSAQSAAASSVAQIVFTANTITPGAFPAPPQGAGVLWEGIRAEIQVNDNSGKLQITLPARISIGTPFDPALAPNPAPLPFTMPAINGANYVLNTVPPYPIWLPTDPPIQNGAFAQIGLINTDTVAPHNYIRKLGYAYRYIFDVDFSKEKVYVMGTLI